MKKLLLTLILLLPLLCSAQSLVKYTQSGYQFYVKVTNEYISEQDFVKKYGVYELIYIVEQAVEKGEISKVSGIAILESHDVKSQILMPGAAVNQEGANITDYLKHPNKPTGNKSAIKMRPVNLTIGCGVIGASFATYAIVIARNNAKLRDYSVQIENVPLGYASQITELDRKLKNGIISQKTYTAEMGKIDNSMKADVDNLKSKCDKAEKNKETTAYICAGTSIAGIITILTGLHREHGIQVANNTYINSTSQGLSASIVF